MPIPFQIGNILSIDRSKLESACTTLGIDPFDSDEYEFLRQYYKLISKVANALKILEGDKNTFGSYLPVLIGLRKAFDKYSDYHSTEIEKCTALGYAIKKGIEKRFGPLMDLNNPSGKSVPLYIAMMTNPKYKLNFMGTSQIEAKVLSKLKDMLIIAGMDVDNDMMNDAVEKNHGNGECESIFHSKKNSLSYRCHSEIKKLKCLEANRDFKILENRC